MKDALTVGIPIPVIHRQSFHFDTRGHRTGVCARPERAARVHTQMQIQYRSRAAHCPKTTSATKIVCRFNISTDPHATMMVL